MDEKPKGSLGSKLSLRVLAMYLLIAYFFILLLLSLAFSVKWVITWNSTDIQCLLTRSIAFSVLGSSIYYLRKLYKNAINHHYIVPNEEEFNQQNEAGTLIYYISRPLFSIGFVLIFYLLIKGQIVFVVTDPVINLVNFGNFMFLSSFFIGFSTGKFIERVLSLSSKHVETDHHTII